MYISQNENRHFDCYSVIERYNKLASYLLRFGYIFSLKPQIWFKLRSKTNDSFLSGPHNKGLILLSTNINLLAHKLCDITGEIKMKVTPNEGFYFIIVWPC